MINYKSIEEIPEIKHQYHSDVLLIKTSDGSIIIGFYNKHDIEERSGYYHTPNFDKSIDAVEYAIAPEYVKLKCGNCEEIIQVKHLVDSQYLPQLNKQVYPCCANCHKCLLFELESTEEE